MDHPWDAADFPPPVSAAEQASVQHRTSGQVSVAVYVSPLSTLVLLLWFVLWGNSPAWLRPSTFGNRVFFGTISPGYFGYYGYPGYYGGDFYSTADYYSPYDYYGPSYDSAAAQNDMHSSSKTSIAWKMK